MDDISERLKKLVLVWSVRQKSKPYKVATVSLEEDGTCTLQYLYGTEDFEDACDKGFNGYPAYPLTRDTYNDVLPTFSCRVISRSRGDFKRFLEKHPELSDICDEFTFISHTGIRLPRDTFNLVREKDG